MITGVIFKRVGVGRPYPEHGLNSRAWAELPPRQVRLDELVTTKDTLQLDTLLDEDSTFYGDLFAHVVHGVATSTSRTGCTARCAPPCTSAAYCMPGSTRWSSSEHRMSAGARSGLTLLGLGLLLAVASVWGWGALTKPFPKDEPVAICEDTAVTAGSEVRRDQIVVSVFNGSKRAGLAGATSAQLAERGFVQGDVGDAPAPAASTQIWADDPTNPAVQLVQRQFRQAKVVPGDAHRRRDRRGRRREVQDAAAPAGGVGAGRGRRDVLQGHRGRVRARADSVGG